MILRCVKTDQQEKNVKDRRQRNKKFSALAFISLSDHHLCFPDCVVRLRLFHNTRLCRLALMVSREVIFSLFSPFITKLTYPLCFVHDLRFQLAQSIWDYYQTNEESRHWKLIESCRSDPGFYCFCYRQKFTAIGNAIHAILLPLWGTKLSSYEIYQRINMLRHQ